MVATFNPGKNSFSVPVLVSGEKCLGPEKLREDSMNILEKAEAERTGKYLIKYASVTGDIKKKPWHGLPTLAEYELCLRVGVHFSVDVDTRLDLAPAFKGAQKHLLRIIYGDLYDLIYNLEIALCNADDDEARSILARIRNEIGLG